MPSAWVDYVKKYAAEKGVSYGCAMSMPEVKSGYAATKPAKMSKAPKAPKMPKAKSKKALQAELAKMLSVPSFV